MFHHDARNYRTALIETEGRFQDEMNRIVAAGQPTALALIQRIQSEIPEDVLVTAKGARVDPLGDEKGRLVLADADRWGRPLHKHALGLLADRMAIPDRYVATLMGKEDFGRRLLAHNFNELLAHDDRRFLVRSVNGEARAVLSDSYRRMDSRPILEAFAATCADIGAYPVEGVGGDLRFEIKAILPIVFRPGGDEVLCFGVALSNSDFGAGALSIRLFALRIWCTNYAKLEEELRKVHLGKRLSDSIEFSRETYDLDTKALASATRDIVRTVLGPDKVNAQVALIERAMAEAIDPKEAALRLPKLGLLKTEAEDVIDVYRTGGVEKLPPGDNTYRLSNAISWVAKAAPTPERRLELEQVAGEVLKAA